MKAKWLWIVWAHLALLLVLAMEVAFVAAAVTYVVPRFEQMAHDGMLGEGFDCVRPWFVRVMVLVRFAVQESSAWIWVVLALLWGLFEWRVRAEHKSYIRLAIMGTASVLMMALVAALAWVLVVPLMLAVPHVQARAPEPLVREAMADIEARLAELDAAMMTKDYDAARMAASRLESELRELTRFGAAAPTIIASYVQDRVDALRERLNAARTTIREVRDAAALHHPERMSSARQRFGELYEQVKHAATTQPSRYLNRSRSVD